MQTRFLISDVCAEWTHVGSRYPRYAIYTPTKPTVCKCTLKPEWLKNLLLFFHNQRGPGLWQSVSRNLICFLWITHCWRRHGRRHLNELFLLLISHERDKSGSLKESQLLKLKIVVIKIKSWQASISSGNALAQKRQHAIIWTNDDPVHWRICISAGLNMCQYFPPKYNRTFTTLLCKCE